MVNDASNPNNNNNVIINNNVMLCSTEFDANINEVSSLLSNF